MSRRPPKGPAILKRWACPCCGHTLFGKSALQARPVAYRKIVITGRKPGDCPGKHGGSGKGSIRVERTVYVDQLSSHGGDLGEFYVNVKTQIMRLAQTLGLVFERRVVEEVVREVVKKVYVRRARKRIKKVAEMATAYVRTPAAKGKRRGRPQKTRGTRVVQSFVQHERWDPNEFVSGGAVDGGTKHEEW